MPRAKGFESTDAYSTESIPRDPCCEFMDATCQYASSGETFRYLMLQVVVRAITLTTTQDYEVASGATKSRFSVRADIKKHPAATINHNTVTETAFLSPVEFA